MPLEARNPTRDRGRIIGRAMARSAVRTLDAPIEIADRTFVSGCDLRIDSLAPYPSGLELQPIVEQLSAFPKPEAWAIYLRRALLALPSPDVDLLDRPLKPLLTTMPRALPTYPSPPLQEVKGTTRHGLGSTKTKGT